MFDEIREVIADKYLNFGFTTEQRNAVLILCAGFLAVGGIFFVLAQGSGDGQTLTSSEISAPLVPTIPAIPEIVELLVVDVSGRVKNPGVYSLDKGARAIDAINLAGGAQSGVDLTDINLAHLLFDGEQIIVGTPKVSYSSSSKAKVAIKVPTVSSPLSLNSATLAELDTLPGIGPVMANRILAYRKSNGPFITVDDLKKISGIGDATFSEISKLVRI
jgi:competence protein ComEA